MVIVAVGAAGAVGVAGAAGADGVVVGAEDGAIPAACVNGVAMVKMLRATKFFGQILKFYKLLKFPSTLDQMWAHNPRFEYCVQYLELLN
jgi:hypothetical protein